MPSMRSRTCATAGGKVLSVSTFVMTHQLRVPRAMLVSNWLMLLETNMVCKDAPALGERPGSRLAAGHREAVALTRVDRRARSRRRRRDAGSLWPAS
jgi:hypothetical protein